MGDTKNWQHIIISITVFDMIVLQVDLIRVEPTPVGDPRDQISPFTARSVTFYKKR